MNSLTTLFAFLATLSLATERITEVVKGLPILSGWLAVEKAPGSSAEALRKACVQVLAIAIGSLLTAMTQDQLSTATGLHATGFWAFLLFGAMASGGSGLWNSALDIVRDVNRQKQMLTDQLKAKQQSAPVS